MQLSTSILIIGGIQLLLLIALLYMTAYFQMCYHTRFPVADIFLAALQALDLILLLQNAYGFKKDHGLLIALHGVFMLFPLFRLARMLRQIQARRYRQLTPLSIRETIDYLPGGICFSTPDGRPILINLKMNELVYRLTKHTIMNARLTWEELRQFRPANGCEKLEEPRMDRGETSEAADGRMFFKLPDGNIWRFRREELGGADLRYVQLEATDISDLYRYSEKLYENNKRLAEQQARRHNLLANIVEINHEKEILRTKMRIHDDLGRSILITKQHLSNQTLSASAHYLADLWDKTIRSLSDFTHIYADEDISPEIELMRAADMIGCHIYFSGDRPSHRKTALLFYATVREALTNAVRHANADQLYVTIRPNNRGYHVEISDNGSVPVSSITEGNGLGNLRRRLEQEGATLQIICEGGVVLIAELPG